MRLIFLLLLFTPIVVLATPFAQTIEHPYSEQVQSFAFSVDGGEVQSIPATDTGAGFRGRFDVGSLVGTGDHSIIVQACNAWGCGAKSVPFVFSTVAPAISSVSGLVP